MILPRILGIISLFVPLVPFAFAVRRRNSFKTFFMLIIFTGLIGGTFGILVPEELPILWCALSIYSAIAYGLGMMIRAVLTALFIESGDQ